MSTPRDNRASAREGRRHLQPPNIPLGRADRIRSRSTSPVAPSTFNFPTTTSNSESNQFEDSEEPLATQYQPVTLLSIDVANGVRTDPRNHHQPQQATNMSTVEEQLEEFRRLAELQQQQLQQYQQQQQEAQRRFEMQQQEYMRRYDESQATVAQLSSALSTLTAHAASLPAAAPTPQRKKPELPPFDPKHINRWIDRLKAAYQRANVTLAKDKFAFLESTFDVAANPRINQFLYGTNTDAEWTRFMEFLKEEYGRTRRQKAALLISEFPRQGLRPSQYLAKVNEDTEGITLDDIKKEHLLKSLPSRVRELLGKDVEEWTADQVATKADSYFDKQGNLLEKSYDINAVNPEPAGDFSPTEEANASEDICHIRRPPNKGGHNRQGRTDFRTSRNPANGQARSASRPGKLTDGLCRSHYKFGEEAYTCVADDCRKRHLPLKKRPSGNLSGERRQ